MSEISDVSCAAMPPTAAPDPFAVLANPTRRRVLEILATGPRTAGSLAAEFELSRPAISEHLQILRLADLVVDEQIGRERHYRLDPRPLLAVSEWLHPFEQYWRDQLATLRTVLEEETP